MYKEQRRHEHALTVDYDRAISFDRAPLHGNGFKGSDHMV